MRACMRACVLACVRVCVRACMRAVALAVARKSDERCNAAVGDDGALVGVVADGEVGEQRSGMLSDHGTGRLGSDRTERSSYRAGLPPEYTCRHSPNIYAHTKGGLASSAEHINEMGPPYRSDV